MTTELNLIDKSNHPHKRSRTKTTKGPKGYSTQRSKFIELLTEEKRRLFDELIELKRKEALYAARYFCLNNEPVKSHKELVPELLSRKGVYSGIVCVSSILRYMDPTFPVSNVAALRAGSMVRWVARKKASATSP